MKGMRGKKLTKEVINTRLTMYDEATAHMDAATFDAPEKRLQADIVRKEIEAIKNSFYRRHQIFLEKTN